MAASLAPELGVVPATRSFYRFFLCLWSGADDSTAGRAPGSEPPRQATVMHSPGPEMSNHFGMHSLKLRFRIRFLSCRPTMAAYARERTRTQ
jgi:hypothetical protein